VPPLIWSKHVKYIHASVAAVAGNLVRYGSAKETEITTSTYNPFADLKARMNDKK
tara:strand:- start:895 stop:1059 length:165 start_codon:yes stop_codon:yes gene_type:complete